MPCGRKLTNRSYIFGSYLLLVAAWVIATVSRIRFNGMTTGLDYGLFQPDGMHYAFRTLTFLGDSQIDAATKVSEWYAVHGVKIKEVAPEALLPQNNLAWPVVKPRLLYPLLSMPFVHFLGLYGMLAIPIISLLIVMVSIYLISKKVGIPHYGLAASIILTASPTFLRWMVANLTDSLLAALFALAALICVREKITWRPFSILVFLVLLTSITRFCLPIWFAIGMVFAVRRQFTYSISIIISSSIAFIPTYISRPEISILAAEQNASTFQRVIMLPYSFLKVGAFEFIQLLALDRLLFVFLIASIILAIRNFQRSANQFFLAVLFSVFVISGINGIIGVNFRYELPVIAFMFWSFFENIYSYLTKQNLKADSKV